MSARGTVERRSSAIQTRHRPLPSTTYQPTAEKGLADGYPNLDGGSLIPASYLGTGTPSATKTLLGDRTWSAFLSSLIAFTQADVLLGRQTAGAGAGEEIALTAAGRALLDDLSAAAQRGTLGLGTVALLNSIATANIDDDAVTLAKIVNIATDKLIGRSTAGTGDPELVDCTAAARALLDDASASAMRTTLGLAALAVLSTVGTSQIDDDAVTYAKIQNVSATDKVLGRSTAGAGNVEEIGFTAAARALADDATAGDMRTTLGVEAYTQGDWTPADGSGAGLSFTTAVGTYERIGRLIIVRGAVVYPSTVDASNAVISGFPVAVASGGDNTQGFISLTGEATALRLVPVAGTTTAEVQNSVGGNVTNAAMSTEALRFTAIYRV